MNLFDILESRMQEIFEGGELVVPIPFKKLAKQATREMKRNAVKSGDKLYAPSLYTVLVSPGDDAMIAPLYQQVTDELVDFVSHEAEGSGLVMPGSPMVRFIADPNVRAGKMSVVAEVVTPDVLDALRQEEEAYTKARMRSSGPRPAAQKQAPARPQPQAPARPQAPAAAAVPKVGDSAPSLPVDVFDAPVRPVEDPSAPQAPIRPVSTPVAPAAAPEPAPAPKPSPAPAPAAPKPAGAGSYHGLVGASCELTDTASGQRWTIGSSTTIIGREDSLSDVVLSDTNVSRRHAELRREGSTWFLSDLGSTNGTRVNGVRIKQPVQLNDGDTIQMGLVALAFREL